MIFKIIDKTDRHLHYIRTKVKTGDGIYVDEYFMIGTEMKIMVL